jgi:hypothetical protein
MPTEKPGQQGDLKCMKVLLLPSYRPGILCLAAMAQRSRYKFLPNVDNIPGRTWQRKSVSPDHAKTVTIWEYFSPKPSHCSFNNKLNYYPAFGSIFMGMHFDQMCRKPIFHS